MLTSSFSTNTNSISFIFGFGLSKSEKLIPKNAKIINVSQAAPKTEGCKMEEMIIDFFKVISPSSSLRTAGGV